MELASDLPLAPKQWEFVKNSTSTINLAHGAVRSGKTVGTLFRFMQECFECPDSQLFIIGKSSGTAYQNIIRLILESPEMAIYRPFCTWAPGKMQLTFMNKTISVLGAKDEGAIGYIQGKTFSCCYCDEMTLYPESVIDMISTRLSKSYSKLFASMNPSYPTHLLKTWIDKAEAGDKNYYALHFSLDDNPFIDDTYKNRIKNSLSGVFYKRNYLGLWCLAEGAIFDFFDRDIHVVDEPPRAAEYWIAAIDYGTVHPFVCLLLGVSTGRYEQIGKCMWVEKEYFWDPKQKGRQKLNSEYADDIQKFLEPYAIRAIYIDPSAEAFQVELQRRKMHVVHANNDVANGIQYMTSEMHKGNLFVCSECTNTIKQLESYVWDDKAVKRGEEKPLKLQDDACDALRYGVFTHKVATYDPYQEGFGKTLGLGRKIF